MNKNETIEKFKGALDKFKDAESYLLKNNLSERCIAHKFAEYLKEEFKDSFDIDCEYNRQYDSVKVEQAIKRIHISREMLIDIAIDRFNKNDTYSVFPDIIIHTRESEDNHLIIEIKKSSNDCKADKDFDEVKLKKFTENLADNVVLEEGLPKPLAYRLGIYLEIGVQEKTGTESIKYFQNGDELSEDKLQNWQ